MGHRMGVLEVSLPKYVNSLYQMSEIGQVIAASFWVTFFVCRKPCHPKLFFFFFYISSNRCSLVAKQEQNVKFLNSLCLMVTCELLVVVES